MKLNLNPDELEKVIKTILEFFARFVMNSGKLIIGLSMGVSIDHNGPFDPALLIASKSVMLVLVVLAVLISAVETWQDWEFVPKEIHNEPANA